MKVLMIPSWYVTEDKPNNGIFFKEQAEALFDSGLDVVVAYADLRFKLDGLRRGVYRDYTAKIPTYVYRKRTFTPFWERGRWPQISKMLEELYQRICRDHGKPDVIQLHSCRIGIEVLELCRKHGLPLVYTEHFSGVERDMDADLKLQFESTLKGCDYAIAVSQDLRARMVTLRPDTLCIPNMVDTTGFKIMPEVAPAGKYVFAAMGNLVPVKGYDVLIRAFARVLHDMPGAMLYIGGMGSEEQNLKKLIQELGLADRVQLVGPVTRRLAPKFYNGCDCFVCSSYTETFGVTLIEALSCGKPVIATRCGGPQDIVNRTNGMLVTAGDPISMSKALVYMYNNSGIYSPFTLREDCIRKFGKDYVCQRMVQVYGHLMQQRHSADQRK